MRLLFFTLIILVCISNVAYGAEIDSKYFNDYYMRDVMIDVTPSYMSHSVSFSAEGYLKKIKNANLNHVVDTCMNTINLDLDDQISIPIWNRNEWCDVFLNRSSENIPKESDDKIDIDDIILTRKKFDQLYHWEHDNFEDAMDSFISSCKRMNQYSKNSKFLEGWFSTKGIKFGDAASWFKICELANTIPKEYSKIFFELYFTPFAVSYKQNDQYIDKGRFTGYYEPLIKGSLEKTSFYKYPVYSKPEECNLGICYTRAQINIGTLENRGLETCWIADYISFMNLQMQGSGILKLIDNSFMRLSYDGGNGYQLKLYSQYLLKHKIAKGIANMDSYELFRKMSEDEDFKHGVYNHDEHYVFLKASRVSTGPIGAIGAELIPLRSVAIDHNYIPYGIPIWIDTHLGMRYQSNSQKQMKEFIRIGRLFVAHDRGSMISGQIRADIFFGFGGKAEYLAENQSFNGKYYLLIPNIVLSKLQFLRIHTSKNDTSTKQILSSTTSKINKVDNIQSDSSKSLKKNKIEKSISDTQTIESPDDQKNSVSKKKINPIIASQATESENNSMDSKKSLVNKTTEEKNTNDYVKEIKKKEDKIDVAKNPAKQNKEHDIMDILANDILS